MHRRRFLRRTGALGTAGASIGLAGCTGVGGDPGFDVGMMASEFRPAEITVAVGDTVVWENTSARTHTVTASRLPNEAEYFASGGYDDYETALTKWENDFGGGLETRDRFSHTFTVPGTHHYVCIPHLTGGMVGTVTVEE